MSRKVGHALHRLHWRSSPITDPGATFSVAKRGFTEKSGTSAFKATYVQVFPYRRRVRTVIHKLPVAGAKSKPANRRKKRDEMMITIKSPSPPRIRSPSA